MSGTLTEELLPLYSDKVAWFVVPLSSKEKLPYTTSAALADIGTILIKRSTTNAKEIIFLDFFILSSYLNSNT